MKGELGRQALFGGSLGNFITTQTDSIISGKPAFPGSDDTLAFIRVKLKPGQDFNVVRQKLDYYLKPYQLKTLLPEDYQNRITFDFIFENKALQGFLFVGILAVIIPLFIVVQTLRSAIMAQNVQFATMRALGVPSRYLISVAMEQALWVGILGAALSYCGMLFIKWQLFERDIFMYLPLNIIINVSAAIISAALLAGLISLFAIFKTQPQELLR
jgi:ABC-type antimicrobial peptide transport system permease subunit